MHIEDIPREVILHFKNKYDTPVLQRRLRLDENLIKEILEVIKDNAYIVLPPQNFPTENFSSTALFYFENAIKSWTKIENKHFNEFQTFIPSEQIIKDLIDQGWVIRPPEGV